MLVAFSILFISFIFFHHREDLCTSCGRGLDRVRASASDVHSDGYLVLFLGVLGHCDSEVAAVYFGYLYQLIEVQAKPAFGEQKFLFQVTSDQVLNLVVNVGS